MFYSLIFSYKAKPALDALFQVEDDMLLDKEQVEVYGAIKNGRSRRAAVKDEWLWPKGIVYYTLNSNLGKCKAN